jgi:ABC-type nickel/cobalt efflux system permease component RcnA
MRTIASFLLTLFLTLPAWAQSNPFATGSKPSALATSSEVAPGFFTRIALTMADWQRGLNQEIAARFTDWQTGGSGTALALILGLSFLYGVVHAAGPGHGKTVVASYLVSRRETVMRGLMIGSAISLIQAVVAIVLVGILGVFFSLAHLKVTDHAATVETVSYALVLALGLWLTWSAWKGHDHHHHHHGVGGHDDHHGHDHHGHDHDHGHHHHHHHDHHHAAPRGGALGLVITAGLTPCASAIIVMLFALALQAFAVGVLAVLVMAVGMAITVSAIGIGTIYARRLVTRLFADRPGAELVEKLLTLGGALALTAFAALMLFGSTVRMAG